MTNTPSDAAAHRLIYKSSNGDAWYLVRSASGNVHIQHAANRPSGGKVSEISVASFLTRSGSGPEHQELMRLIATPVD